MRTLEVTDFSCIQKASLELGQLTLIIGPQASGKSVLCKLSYFLFDCAQLQRTSIVRKESFEKFVIRLKERFIEWFPIEAWGPKRFKIELSAGDYSITLARITYGGKVSNNFRVKISVAFQLQYELLLDDVQKISEKFNTARIQRSLEFDWEFGESISKSLKQLMGKDYVAYQAFVPAGRSFFTSIGKAIAVFEQAKVLDPLIIRFGRLYTTLKDQSRYFNDDKSSDTAARKALEKTLAELLGGFIERDGDKRLPGSCSVI